MIQLRFGSPLRFCGFCCAALDGECGKGGRAAAAAPSNVPGAVEAGSHQCRVQ